MHGMGQGHNSPRLPANNLASVRDSTGSVDFEGQDAGHDISSSRRSSRGRNPHLRDDSRISLRGSNRHNPILYHHSRPQRVQRKQEPEPARTLAYNERPSMRHRRHHRCQRRCSKPRLLSGLLRRQGDGGSRRTVAILNFPSFANWPIQGILQRILHCSYLHAERLAERSLAGPRIDLRILVLLLMLIVASSSLFSHPTSRPASGPSEAAISISQDPSSAQYVTTFSLAVSSCTGLGTGFSPWVVSPSNNSRTIWLGAISLSQPFSSQIINFTISPPATQPLCHVVDTLPNAILGSIVFDKSSGRVWFTFNDTLAYIDPATGTPKTAWIYRADNPSYISIDSKDNLWLTLVDSNKIAQYIPPPVNETFTSSVPTPSAVIQGIAVSPSDGTVWFAEPGARKLGHLIPCGGNSCSVQDFPPPAGVTLSSPIQVAVDSKGVVWFTDHGSNQFGSFNPSTKEWRVYPVGHCDTSYCSNVLPNAISLDSQGKIWFAEHIAGRIASYDSVRGVLTEYTIPSPGDTPLSWWAWPGPNNLVWFTALALNQIGYVNASLPVPLNLTATTSTITLRQGSSQAVPVRTNYQGQGPFTLGLSPTSIDSGFFSASSTSSPPSTGASTSSFTIAAAWNTTLGARQLALTASNGQVAVSIHVTVNIVDAPLPYVTLGFASITILGVPVIFLRWRRGKKLRPVKQTRR